VRLLNYALLCFLGLVWGSSFLFIELALQSYSAIAIAAVRITEGAIILCGALWLSRHSLPRTLRPWLLLLVLAVIGTVLPFFLINYGQSRITSSLSAILIATVPIFTLVLAHFFTDDRITPAKAIGVVLGMIGIGLLFGPAALEGLTDSVIGQLLVMAGAFCYAVNGVIARRLLGVAPMVSGAVILAFAALISVPLAFGFDRPLAIEPTWQSVVGLIGLGVFSTGLAFLALYRLLATAGPNFVSANNYLAACVGVTWGVVLLGEPLTWRMVVALAVTLIGIAIATYGTAAHGYKYRPAEKRA
jgi:drug/metabolite transporter (DMT)-like permease